MWLQNVHPKNTYFMASCLVYFVVAIHQKFDFDSNKKTLNAYFQCSQRIFEMNLVLKAKIPPPPPSGFGATRLVS